MPSQQHTILVRLLRAYKLLLGALLFILWVMGTGYFILWERDELTNTVRTVATMVATQSAAALMFGDAQVLQENLGSLRFLRGYRWSAVVPMNVDIPMPLTTHGAAPSDVKAVLAEIGTSPYRMGWRDLTVHAPINHLNIERGQLLVGVDLGEEIEGYVEVLASAMLLLAVAFYLGQRAFRRIVQSIVAPLGELIQVTAAVSSQIKNEGSLVDLPRPSRDFEDEVGQLSQAFNVMLDSLDRHDARMRDQAAQLERLVEDLRALSARMRAVREEERTRISHEIHDELGQRLTALKYEVARLNVGEAGKAVSQQIDELIRTVRVISWELRPSVLDSLGLVAAIEWQAQDFARRIGVRCSVDLPEDEPRLPSEMTTDLFRVFQELLTNVSRHAQATRVDVLLEITETTIYLEVKDDGRGVRRGDENLPSLGLLGMRERLERWGGQMNIGSAVEEPVPAGTRVVIEIPLASKTLVSDLEQAS